MPPKNEKAKKAQSKRVIPPQKGIKVHIPEKWRIRVSRFNPLMDFQPRTHEYEVTSREGESILELLLRIKHSQDGSLTFRASCGYGGCGTCGVKVNGKSVLGCVTQVNEHLDQHQTLRIDPLYEEKILKDLVVDETQFFHELLKVKPWLVSRPHEEKRHHKMGITDVNQLGNSQQCIMCGLCNSHSAWEKSGELGPASFVKGFRYAWDIRDGDTKRMAQLETFLPVHYSLEKANLCPRGIFPGDKIREIREKASKTKEKMKENGERTHE